ncbi:hypothetical protein ACQY0O_000587 [Thecaphora frezii]
MSNTSSGGDMIRGNISRLTTKAKLELLRIQDSRIQRAKRKLIEALASTPRLIPISLSPLPPDSYGGPLSFAVSLDALEIKLSMLKDIVCKWNPNMVSEIEAIDTFFRVTRLDPRTAQIRLPSWHAKMDEKWTQLSTQAQVSLVFCDVVQQWLDTDAQEPPKVMPTTRLNGGPPVAPGPVPVLKEDGPPFFSPEAFLRQHNFSDAAFAEIEEMRTSARNFAAELWVKGLCAQDVKDTMEALASDTNVLSTVVRNQLAEEQKNEQVVANLVTTYNAWLRNMHDWSWPHQGVPQVSKYHINGDLRRFLDLDVVNYIYIELLGRKWARHFGDCIRDMHNHELWPKKHIINEFVSGRYSQDDLHTWLMATELAQGEERGFTSLDQIFEDRQVSNFMYVLQSLGANHVSYDGRDYSVTTDSCDGWLQAPLLARSEEAYAVAFKYITGDIRLFEAIAPDRHLIFLHADVDNFYGTIPHQVYLAVLDFFGMPIEWLDWVLTFLNPPVLGVDGKVEPQRSCGAPFGFTLSTLLNEMLLILLEAALSFDLQMPLMRKHGQMWLWSLDEDKMVKAWKTMQDFGEQTGLRWNTDKSGSCVVENNSTTVGAQRVPAELPRGPFRWGLLSLRSDGTWQVENRLIEAIVTDARKEMDACRSFLGRVHVWNKYQAYVARNTCYPVSALGKPHYRHVQAAFNEMQRMLTGGQGLVGFMRQKLCAAFPQHASSDIPDGVFVWPLELGGFHLHIQQLNLIIHEDGLDDIDEADELPYSPCYGEALQDFHVNGQRWYSQAAVLEWHEAAQPGSTHKYAEWVAQQPCRPEMVDRQTYTLLSIAFDDFWGKSYNRLLDPIEVDGEEYAEQAKRMFALDLERLVGRGREMMSVELVPNYALGDLKDLSKKLFVCDL